MNLDELLADEIEYSDVAYDDPNGAHCVVAIGEIRWCFVVEPNIDDGFKDGATSLGDEYVGFPDDLAENHAPGVYEARTTYRWWPGNWEAPSEGDYEIGLEIGRCLYRYERTGRRHD